MHRIDIGKGMTDRIIEGTINILKNKNDGVPFRDIKDQFADPLIRYYEDNFNYERDREATYIQIFNTLCHYCSEENAEIKIKEKGRSYNSYIFCSTQQ